MTPTSNTAATAPLNPLELDARIRAEREREAAVAAEQTVFEALGETELRRLAAEQQADLRALRAEIERAAAQLAHEQEKLAHAAGLIDKLRASALLRPADDDTLSLLHQAVIANEPDLVRLFAPGSDLERTAGDAAEDTPLRRAVREGHAECVRVLLEMDPDPVAAVNSSRPESRSAFFLAIQNPEILSLILPHANLASRYHAMEGLSVTPLRAALVKPESLALLLPRVDVNEAFLPGADNSPTALSTAAEEGYLESFRILLRAPGILLDRDARAGVFAPPSAMAAALTRDRADIVKELLPLTDISRPVPGLGGDTPLILAAARQANNCFSLLLEKARFELDFSSSETRKQNQETFAYLTTGGVAKTKICWPALDAFCACLDDKGEFGPERRETLSRATRERGYKIIDVLPQMAAREEALALRATLAEAQSKAADLASAESPMDIPAKKSAPRL